MAFKDMKNNKTYIIDTYCNIKNKNTNWNLKFRIENNEKQIMLYENGTCKEFFVDNLVKVNFTFDEILKTLLMYPQLLGLMRYKLK